MNDRTWDRLSGLLIGVAAGFVAGILLAPSAGQETRNSIKKKTQDSIDQVSGSVRDISASITKKGRDLWRRGVTELEISDEESPSGEDEGQGA